MNKIFIILLISMLFILFSYQQQSVDEDYSDYSNDPIVEIIKPSFQGTWTDSCDTCYGGKLYICSSLVNDDNEDGIFETIEGSYSEIGRLVGSVHYDFNKNVSVAEGIWSEAGFNDYTTGGFHFELGDTNGIAIFEGYWWYDDQECLKNEWNADRIKNVRPLNNTQCKIVSIEESSTIDGVWRRTNPSNENIVDSFSICLEDTEYGRFFTMSYNIGEIQGFSYGQVTDDLNVAKGSYYTSDFNQGILYIWVNFDGDVRISMWDVENIAAVTNNGFNTQPHLVINLIRTILSDSSRSECLDNKELVQIDWNGVFSDNVFGEGRFYICSEGVIAQGVYSEFGYIHGIIDSSGTTIRGNWHDSGARFQDQGNFVIHLDFEGFFFEGEWDVDGIDSKIPWVEIMLDESNFYSDQCYWLYNPSRGAVAETDLNGRFLIGPQKSDHLDMCLYQNGTAEGSYFNNGVEGYIRGTWDEDGQTVQAFYFEDDPSYSEYFITDNRTDIRGIEIQRNTNKNSLTRFTWKFKDAGSFFFVYCEDDETINLESSNGHDVSTLSRELLVISASNCQRNKHLYRNLKDDDDYYLIIDSSATSLNITITLIFAFLSFLFFYI
eukprot:TRINITY_DN1739_c2_g1_i1.p1 TRINITY_DN1739_c2_g1~~TRINITY_DN1739_c2_g1_i1.p1  ORF type:complete len:606 (-),score=174.14 TRINITY_DN1739_c2_g1_i1:317-2134(-)